MDAAPILKILEHEGPVSPAEIATRLGIAEVEVAARIKELEEKHLLLGYRAIVDWEKVGDRHIYAFIQVNARPERGKGFDRLGEHIARFEEVHAVHLVSGTHDLNVIVHGDDLAAVAKFVTGKLAPLEGVDSTATSFILKSYKLEDRIIETEDTDKRQAVSA